MDRSPQFVPLFFIKGKTKIKETVSAGAHAQLSPVETNLHTTRRSRRLPLQNLSKISRQTAAVITKERLEIKNSANFPKMNAIQTDEKSFLDFRTVFEKVGPTISKCFSSTRACLCGDIVPLKSEMPVEDFGTVLKFVALFSSSAISAIQQFVSMLRSTRVVLLFCFCWKNSLLP